MCAHTKKSPLWKMTRINSIIWPGGLKADSGLRGASDVPFGGRYFFLCAYRGDFLLCAILFLVCAHKKDFICSSSSESSEIRYAKFAKSHSESSEIRSSRKVAESEIRSKSCSDNSLRSNYSRANCTFERNSLRS